MLGALWPVVLVDMANGRRFDARFGPEGLRDQRSKGPAVFGTFSLRRVAPARSTGRRTGQRARPYDDVRGAPTPPPCSSARPADFMIKQLGGGLQHGVDAWFRPHLHSC